MIMIYAHFLNLPTWEPIASDWTTLDNVCRIADFGCGIGGLEAIYVGF